MTEVEIRHEPERRRFVAVSESDGAVLEYRPRGDGTLVYHHTYVPHPLRGRGIATRIVRYALDYARDNGLSVVPSCPFVARVIDRYPEYRELVA